MNSPPGPTVQPNIRPLGRMAELERRKEGQKKFNLNPILPGEYLWVAN